MQQQGSFAEAKARIFSQGFWAASGDMIFFGLDSTEPATRVTTQGPSWGYLKVNFSETLSIFGDKRPRNGSKYGSVAPSTGLGCPHIGPSVGTSAPQPCFFFFFTLLT